MCHIPHQDVIESDRIKKKMCVCVGGGGGGGGGGADAIKLSCAVDLEPDKKNASEIWNLYLDLNLHLDLDPVEIWVSIASNKMLI